jgi:putative Holliday junction resolvase
VNYLGIDYGHKRVGRSICHSGIEVPLPIDAIISDDDGEKIQKICEIVAKNQIDEVIIGYPINMDGTLGNKVKQVDGFIKKLSSQLPERIKVNRVDERLTSEQALNKQKTFHAKQSISKTKKQRKPGVVDSRAAMIILHDFLHDLELGVDDEITILPHDIKLS